MNVVKEPVFNFPKFEDIPVSTMTYIITCNFTVDIAKLFEVLPITEYVIVPKRRGRKKKIATEDHNENVKPGSIIGLSLGGSPKGILVEKKKKSKDGSKFFRNSLTIVMTCGKKLLNAKLSQNSRVQLTGCKFPWHAEFFMKNLWQYITQHRNLYTIDGPLKAIFLRCMENRDLSLGINLDREKLDQFINKGTQHCSVLERHLGYTGLNIKMHSTIPFSQLQLKVLTYEELKEDWNEPTHITYEEYLNSLKPKERQKKLDKPKMNTFLVFHSGKVIVSCMTEEFGRDSYYTFLDIIKNNYKEFQERLDT